MAAVARRQPLYQENKMTDATIRIGIVGAGGNTRAKHIPGLRAIAGVEIVGVCNRSEASSAKVAAEFQIPKVYRNWRALVNDDAVDAVVIGTWPYMHAPVSLAALAAGKHVLCEARMAMNAREAHKMLAAARRRPDLVAQVVPAPFTLRVDRTVQRLLSEGFIGRPLVLDVYDNGSFIDTAAGISWRQETDYSGLNVMMLGIWYEAVMRWLGPAASVLAMGRTFADRLPDAVSGLRRTVEVPDHLDVVAALACGVQAHFRSTRVCGLSGASHCLLFGETGTLRFEGDRLFGGRRGDKGLQAIAIPTAEAGGWRVEESFINAIRGLEPVRLTSFEDGVRYMEFTEAVQRSRQTGAIVHLPLGEVTPG
jgi:predicted dehydrogenase